MEIENRTGHIYIPGDVFRKFCELYEVFGEDCLRNVEVKEVTEKELTGGRVLPLPPKNKEG